MQALRATDTLRGFRYTADTTRSPDGLKQLVRGPDGSARSDVGFRGYAGAQLEGER